MTRLKLSVTCRKMKLFHLESRHLGLVTPQEMENLQEKVRQAGEILAKTVDLELLEKIAGEAAVWKTEVIRRIGEGWKFKKSERSQFESQWRVTKLSVFITKIILNY